MFTYVLYHTFQKNAIGELKIDQKKRSRIRKNQAPKRNPASNYSPTVKYAVPSSLGPLSIVFGMGT